MTHWLLIRGSLLDAYRAARRHGVRIVRIDTAAAAGARAARVYVDATAAAMVPWYAEGLDANGCILHAEVL